MAVCQRHGLASGLQTLGTCGVCGEDVTFDGTGAYTFPTTALTVFGEVMTGEADIAADWMRERGEQPETD
jgi:hypothetical protein